VVHSAAAMTFRPDDRGEPWRTNVEGVGNLLKLCQETGIRKFHHISTAYICGLRTGRILEEEVDLGQPLGNVYEQSKLKAETMVRSAPFLDELTVYRPSSIVGDSRTGFTTSYHGFYLPLQLAYAMANRIPPAQMDERFVSLLGLTGREGKNLVPVDWLSAAIAALVTRPECHGVTYHLASPSPVPVRLVHEVVQEAVGKYSGRPPAKRVDQAELAAYERLFQDHMEVYKSHWRDDPEFDLTNSSGVLGHIPCPAMDRDLLMRVARFAVESKFSLRRHESAETPFDVARHLQPLVDAARQLDGAPGTAESIALQVNGRGGGQWHLWTSAGRLVGAELGLGARSTARFYLGAAAFAALARGGATVEAAIGAGQVVVEGDRKAQPGLIRILKQVVSAR